MTTLKSRQVLAALTFTGLAAIAQLTAQTALAKRAGDVVTMSKFEGKDEPIAQQILRKRPVGVPLFETSRGE